MPYKSQAQSRFIHWVDENPKQAAAEGIKPGFAHKFVADSHGQKVSKLPQRVQHKAHGGAVTRKATRW